MSVHVFLSSQNITWVFACCFSWVISICLNLTWVSLVQDSLYYWGNQRLSLDLTLGFSHSCRSLRSTYLGCSFNFYLLHLTAIFGGSFVTICCILVAGLKPAPWMFSQHMLRELSNCFHPDLLISSANLLISDFEIRAGFPNRSVSFSYYCKKDLYFFDDQGLTNFAARHMHLLR